jgi:hypothetical protein
LNTPILISLVRGRDGIGAWISQADETADGLAHTPLSRLPASLHPQALLADWQQLQARKVMACEKAVEQAVVRQPGA